MEVVGSGGGRQFHINRVQAVVQFAKQIDLVAVAGSEEERVDPPNDVKS